MEFKEFYEMNELMEEFDRVIGRIRPLNEAQLGDLDMGNVIASELDNLGSAVLEPIMSAVVEVAKYSGAKVKDILRLFTPAGLSAVKEFISSNIVNSAQVNTLKRRYNEPDRYKKRGIKGLENRIEDMQKNEPDLFDSLQTMVSRILK